MMRWWWLWQESFQQMMIHAPYWILGGMGLITLGILGLVCRELLKLGRYALSRRRLLQTLVRHLERPSAPESTKAPSFPSH